MIVLPVAMLLATAQSVPPSNSHKTGWPFSDRSKILRVSIRGRGRIVFSGRVHVASNGGSWITGDIRESVSCRETAKQRNVGVSTIFRLSISSNPIADQALRFALWSAPNQDHRRAADSCQNLEPNAKVFERQLILPVNNKARIRLDDYTIAVTRLE